MAFFGRKEQLDSLSKLYAASGVQIGLVYGRRRVGKSELIKQSLRLSDIKSIYYECKQTSQAGNTESLSFLLAEAFEFPKPDFRGIEELLDFLFRKAAKEPLILVLDEYPYLRETVKGMDSILQSLIDRYRETSALKIILCGSFVEVMKSLLLSDNPLYGRIDRSVDLKPMDYYESALFYPDFSAEDKVRLYSVFGGIPYYNRLIDPKSSVRRNIIELIASPGARLENEVALYLTSEISKINNANEVFKTLAAGFQKFSDLLAQSHVTSGPTLADVLEKLVSMEVVRKEAPINDENNRRKAGYFISDNLSLFYYRYIFRYSSQMQVLPSDVFFDRYIAEDFEARYVPRVFETVCKQYLIRMNRSGKLPVPFDRIGKYYYDDPKTHTNGEFDIVTEDPEGYTFYEAKFRREPVSKAMIDAEIAQVKNAGFTCRRYGFFSRSGFSAPADEQTLLITLAELFR